MVQPTTESIWQAEARSEETRQFIRDIKRMTRRKFTAEEKIRIVLEGFRRDTPIRDLCRREGIQPSTYYAWLARQAEGRLDDRKGGSRIPWNRVTSEGETKVLAEARASAEVMLRL
jgi:transposase-like protein